MEELGEDIASSSSSKMDQQEETSETTDNVEGVVSITLPEQLQKITPAEEFVSVRHRWNTNEEIASILIAFDRHKEWLVLPQKIRPASGSMLLYNRKVVFYRRDGYCWKKRRNGSTIREDHMKLKVQGLECIYGSYVHSAILPTFHRRCYWLLQNPNIVLLHYLNVPYPETAKPSILSVSSELKGSEWTKEELVDQLRPMLSRVGQNSEQETDEEGKLEKILEELLPMLMPMHESKKSVAYTHSLASQPLILAPASTTISSHPFIPRQTANLSLIQPLTSQHDMTLVKSKIQPTKIQSQTTSKKFLQSSNTDLTQMPSFSQGFQQPIVFQCHGQSVNIQTQSIGKQQHQQQHVQATAKCCTISEVKPEMLAMRDRNANKADSFTSVLQGQTENNVNLKQENSQSSSHHSQQQINDQQLSGNIQILADNMIETSSHLHGANNTESIFINSDVAMVNTFSAGGVTEDRQSGGMVIQNQHALALAPIHDPPSTSGQLTLTSSHHSHNTLASPIVNLHQASPLTSMKFIPESQQQQQNPSEHQDQQSPQHLAQQNHSFVRATAAQQNNQVTNSSLPHYCVISSSQHQQQQPHQQQQQQQQQTPLLTLHLKPGDGSSASSPGFVLSLQGATLVTPDTVSMPASSGTQPINKNINNNSNNASSFNISDPSGLVLVASQNQSGQLVLNRISNGSSTQPPLLSQPPAPGAPFVIQSRLSSELCVSPSPVMDNAGMDVGGQVSATSFVAVGSQLTDAGSSFQSHHHHPQNSKALVFTPLTHGLQSSCPSKEPSSFINSNCKTSSTVTGGEGLQQGNPDSSNHHPLTSVHFPAEAKTTGFGNKDSDELLVVAHSSTGDQAVTTKDSISPPSFDMLFSKDHNSYVHAFDAVANMGKNGNKMDVGSSLYASELQHGHGQSQITSHSSGTSDLMAGPSRTQHTDKEMSNPASCDTLDGSFSSLPGADLNLDDLLDLEEVGDLVTSLLSATDISTATPSYSWGAVASGKGVGSEATQSGGCPDLMPARQGASQGSIDKALASCSGVSVFGFSQQQPPFHHHQQQQQHQISPTSPNHPGAPPRSGGLTPASLFPSFPTFTDNHQSVLDTELNSVIKDFSPDWAYSKSNAKVLIAGPWSSQSSQYTCVFDDHHIPASLIQTGLLRCFTPYHGVGYATLQIARDGVVISNCEIFEFRERENQNVQTSHPDWFAFETKKLKLLLFERLDQLQRRLTSFRISFQDIPDDSEVMESILVQRVQSLVSQPWSKANSYPKAGQHNLTVLHMAAALDLAKLISCFIKWRLANSCVALDFEVDALSVDSHSCTPLMWACGLGNIDAALTLYRWNALPLKICNKDGVLPLALARQKGFYNLANQIEQLERAKEEAEANISSAGAGEEDKSSVFGGEPPLMGSMDITCPSPLSPDHMTTMVSSPLNASEMPVDLKCHEQKDEAEAHLTRPPSFPKPMKPGPKLVRRFSEQVIGQTTRTLSKRNSVDLLPSGQDIDQATLPSISSPLATPIRETTSEPQLMVSPDMTFVAPPAPRLLLEDKIDEPSCVYTAEPLTSRMDTDEIGPVANSSPIFDVERISSDEEIDQSKDDSKHQMVTLANQIIAAIPERIKLSPSKGEDLDDSSSGRRQSESHSSLPSQGSPRPSSFGDDSGISTPMTDSLAFEEYRYPEFGTPASSLSPDSTCLPSPYSPYSFTLDSPPPTTAEFTEYFNAPTTYMEKDFSQLTLSDQEQRKLYEAAKVIQNAYRHYRDKQQQQQKEIEAAVLIQSYYRRYKTYAYYKKMSHAAVLIQNQFRTYYAKRKKRGDSSGTLQGLRRESERLKKGRNQSVIIQQRFRSHYQRKSLDGKEGSSSSQTAGDATESSPPPQEANSQCPEESQITDADLKGKEDNPDNQSAQTGLPSIDASGSSNGRNSHNTSNVQEVHIPHHDDVDVDANFDGQQNLWREHSCGDPDHLEEAGSLDKDFASGRC